MGRLFFLLFTPLLYQAEVAIALDSDRDQPAIIYAQDIEIDFATGRRIYRGDVTIQQGTLHMTGDEIHLFFDDDVLQRAIVHGQPAVFRQQPEGSDHLIRGQAQTIEFDEIENVAIFSGEAKLQQRLDTITGETIIYHMENEKLTIRGSVTMPSQTTRLSTSDATENTTNVMSDLSAQPRVVIQPKSGAASGESADTSSDEEEVKSPGDSLQFHAARVIGAGTAAYSEPGADTALLGGLSGGMPVKVLEVRNGWARVTIPNGINVWVFASYITQDRNGQARVQGRGVRGRRLASTDSRIVGELAHGERVRVLATQNQWKQISLPPSIAAWVPVSQLEMLEAINPAWRSDWQAQTGVSPAIGN